MRDSALRSSCSAEQGGAQWSQPALPKAQVGQWQPGQDGSQMEQVPRKDQGQQRKPGEANVRKGRRQPKYPSLEGGAQPGQDGQRHGGWAGAGGYGHSWGNWAEMGADKLGA